MKKLVQVSILLSFLFFGKSLSAQHVFKFGPSFMYSWSWFDDQFYPNFGGDISYEFAVGKKSSIDIGAIFHYGNHKSIFNPNTLQKNYFIGGHTEFRRHFNGVFNGGYLGIGGDIQWWNAKFETAPGEMEEESNVGLEVNVGASFGYLASVDAESLNFKLARDFYINPYVYVGFNPTDQNEYTIHTRLGLNFGF